MALPKEEQYTFADVLTWDESERIELINGIPYMMSPPLTVHQGILIEMSTQINSFLKGKKCRLFPAPFGVRLFEQDGDSPDDVDTIVEPDISVICDRSKLDKYGCKGAPDFIVEILSPSTQRHDRLVKFDLYQRAGVREYWIVDPERKFVQVLLLEEGRYHAPLVYGAEEQVPVTVLECCVVDLAAVFAEE